MARGEQEDYDRQPRWNTGGYWTDRREGEDWEGDQSLSRNYNREDQRRYGSRSVDQGQQIRNLRSQEHEPWDAQLDTDEIGIHDEHALDFDRYRDRDWGYDRDYGTNRQQRERTRQQNQLQRKDKPRQQEQRQQWQSRGSQDRDRYSGRPGGQMGSRLNDDFAYDSERDYRNNENIGRDLSMEGSDEPGQFERDPYRNRDYDRSNYSRGYDPDRSKWDEGDRGDDQWGENRPRRFIDRMIGPIRDRFRNQERDRSEREERSRSREPGNDTYDNYWGQREQGRRFRDRYQNTWWDNAGGRGSVTSARRPDEGNLPQGVNSDNWDDEVDFDMDPGYSYEFGTDFDFMDDVDAEQARRRGGLPGNRSSQGDRQNQIRAEMEYGWQGAPYQRQARYREIWNVPGPYQGVGPSNYQRNDDFIHEEINEIFTQNGRIDASEIDVQVKNGEIILSGKVDRRQEKYLAEDLASDVIGVQNIENRIRVRTSEGARMSSMGRENIVLIGRIRPGMRVLGVDGKRIGEVKEVRQDGFFLGREEHGDTFIPFRAVKRTDGQIILHVHANEIDQQNWKSNQ